MDTQRLPRPTAEGPARHQQGIRSFAKKEGCGSHDFPRVGQRGGYRPALTKLCALDWEFIDDPHAFILRKPSRRLHVQILPSLGESELALQRRGAKGVMKIFNVRNCPLVTIR